MRVLLLKKTNWKSSTEDKRDSPEDRRSTSEPQTLGPNPVVTLADLFTAWPQIYNEKHKFAGELKAVSWMAPAVGIRGPSSKWCAELTFLYCKTLRQNTGRSGGAKPFLKTQTSKRRWEFCCCKKQSENHPQKTNETVQKTEGRLQSLKHLASTLW